MQCRSHEPRPTSKLTTVVAGRRRGLLTARKDDNVYVKKPQRYAEFNATALNCIRSHCRKSDAYVTNDKRLCWTFCIIEVSY